MSEFTGFAASPMLAEPSEESARLLKRTAHNRKIMDRVKAHGVSLRLMRLLMDAIALTARPPKGGTVRKISYGGVPGRLVTARGADAANGLVLWVHGGGFVYGSPRLEQGLAAIYSGRSGLPVFMPRYRLAPEHPFPAAADDVLDAYLALLREGISADTIRVCGASAGGALVAGLLGDLGRGGVPMPAAVLLLSPLLDLSAESAHKCDAVKPDPFNSPDFIERTNNAYLGDAPLSDPRLAILDADMRGWPPVLVQTGGTECISGEAELLGAAMAAAGARCEVQIWAGQIHVFMAWGAKKIPEAKAALEYGGQFLRTCGA
jgi:epsilon-lactone hydrolase